MRKILTLLPLLFCVTFAFGQTNADLMKTIFGDLLKIDDTKMNVDRPIANYNRLAMQQADTMYIITKDNMSVVMAEAKKYAHAIISVDRHTIVRIDNWNDCVQSGSWGVCMPKGKGYIQRGAMEEKNDYINNIIGRPDGQRRTLFLFK